MPRGLLKSGYIFLTLAAVVVHEGWGLLELRGVSMSLEDVFINLVTKEEAAA